MDAESVVEFWELFEAHGLEVCIDGGWAVDAALGEQTRDHGDLDIALPAVHVPELRRILADRGFVEVPSDDTWEHNFVLGDPAGRRVDVHSHILAADGSSLGGVLYVASDLTGRGEILGVKVRCVPPEVLVGFHSGYTIDETDWHDVSRLCRRFGIAVPDEYRRFV